MIIYVDLLFFFRETRVLGFPTWPNHLGAENPPLFALMERINIVHFPKRQIIRKSFRQYFSLYIYIWVSLMFQEFIIQETKARNKKKSDSEEKKLYNLPSYLFVPPKPVVGRNCICVSNRCRFLACKALLAY